jgi:hypothetical protein
MDFSHINLNFPQLLNMKFKQVAKYCLVFVDGKRFSGAHSQMSLVRAVGYLLVDFQGFRA